MSNLYHYCPIPVCQYITCVTCIAVLSWLQRELITSAQNVCFHCKCSYMLSKFWPVANLCGKASNLEVKEQVLIEEEKKKVPTSNAKDSSISSKYFVHGSSNLLTWIAILYMWSTSNTTFLIEMFHFIYFICRYKAYIIATSHNYKTQ